VLLRNTVFCFTKYNYKTKIFPLISINNRTAISERVIKISLCYVTYTNNLSTRGYVQALLDFRFTCVKEGPAQVEF